MSADPILWLVTASGQYYPDATNDWRLLTPDRQQAEALLDSLTRKEADDRFLLQGMRFDGGVVRITGGHQL
jgi:hypothetical protein